MVSLISPQRPKPGNSQIWAGMYLPYHCMLYYVVWLLLEGAGTHAYTFRGEAWGGRRKVRERERERRKERRCFFLYIPFSMVCLVRRRLSSRVDPHIFSCWSPLIISFSRSSTESIGRTAIRLYVWHVVDLIFFFLLKQWPVNCFPSISNGFFGGFFPCVSTEKNQTKNQTVPKWRFRERIKRKMVTQLECAPWTVKNSRSVSSAMNAARRIGHPSGGCLTPWLLLLLLAASSSNADNLGKSSFLPLLCCAIDR